MASAHHPIHLPIFIEVQDYTLAEMPRFLTNYHFREHLFKQVKHNKDAVEFWQQEFQPKQAEAALTRVRTLLGHPYVRHIIGQKHTTIDFSIVMKERKILLVKLSANLPSDIKKFIGTILISELLHAVRNRPEEKRHQFSI